MYERLTAQYLPRYKSDKANKTNTKGFTLIELLVVIAIISLLATVVMVSLGQSRQKAETARVKGDFRSISHALELYRQAQGSLPSASTGMTVEELVTGPLAEYLGTTPSMPPRLIISPHVYYYTNPALIDSSEVNYNCGSPLGNQEYFVSFTASQAAIDDAEFPQLYERDNPTPPDDSQRCLEVEPN